MIQYEFNILKKRHLDDNVLLNILSNKVWIVVLFILHDFRLFAQFWQIKLDNFENDSKYNVYMDILIETKQRKYNNEYIKDEH